MISVIVYGRNDAHGYNLHKRAALSLNCIAHVLTEPDDEIIFVDYNTPPEMPVFLEGIRDTLTDEALERIRVIRVPAQVHSERFASRTHLAVLEPVARNVGLRRSDPSNRWVLSTNTDMLFIPTGSTSLSAIVAELPDAYWSIPRFQVPEVLWERLDRREPQDTIDAVGYWGSRFSLDEPVTSFDWMGYDAPGDFQLVPRNWIWALNGFDESMLLGWHVDSNLARRISLAYGVPRTLDQRVRGYHCDHTRIPGVFHGAKRVENDAHKYIFDIDRADLLEQDEWGLRGLELEELDPRSTMTDRLPAALERVLPSPAEPLQPVESYGAQTSFTYPAAHVVPYVASALSVLPRDAVVGYVGCNLELVAILEPLLREIGFRSELQILATGPGLENGVPRAVAAGASEIARDADAVIFDFGLPADQALVSEPKRFSHWSFEARRPLGRTFVTFQELAKLDASGSALARPLRSYVVVNAVYNLFEGPVDEQLAGAGKQFTTRVRHGHARPAVDPDPQGMIDARALRLALGIGVPEVIDAGYALGEYLDLTQAGFEGHLAGDWSWAMPFGTWTEGPRVGFLLDLDRHELVGTSHAVFAVRIDEVHVPRGRNRLSVDVEIGGETVERWELGGGSTGEVVVKRALLDASTVRHGGPLRIDLVVHGASSPLADGIRTDPRELGLLVTGACLGATGACLEGTDASLGVGDRVDLGGHPLPSPVLGSGWTCPDEDGTWSVGPLAVLHVPPLHADAESVDVALELADVFVRSGQDPFELEVAVDNEPYERWSFDRRGPHERHLRLEARDRPTLVTLRMPAAVSCRSIGESADPRYLGCKIARIAFEAPVEERAGPARGKTLRPRDRIRRALHRSAEQQEFS